ncbi:restriction endonuclease subunit S [Psychrobacter urativorans]|uniref:restriction endonuclease subunit S n=1 Tax=Psychrobacter urativorans TaxID=45610 RepID=UPI0019191FAF|nr:restriction endonuclease subunit S [Psychrobacter urativorans]
MVPSGWEVKTLEQANITVTDGDRGKEYPKSSEFFDSGYCLFLSAKNVTKNGFSFLDTQFISEEKHRKLRKGVVKKGDIVLTTRGSVGQFAYYDQTVNFENIRINSGMVTLGCLNSELESDFFYALSKSSLIARQIDSAAFGSAQPQLTVKIIKSLKLPVPPIPEQQKIAKILTTWDKAISTTEHLIDNSTQQKKALMQQLLTGKKRLLDGEGKRFDKKWERIELGKLLDYKQPTPYLVQSTDYSDEYPTPVLTAGKTFILGYTDEEFGIFSEDLPTIIFDDFTTASKFVDFPFKAKSSAMKMLVAKDGVSIKYIFEVMQALSYAIGGHQRHWISIFANIVIGLPCREEQQKITTVSNNADKETQLLEQQLADLQQEKKALMQVLLTGKKRVVIDS